MIAIRESRPYPIMRFSFGGTLMVNTIKAIEREIQKSPDTPTPEVKPPDGEATNKQ